MCSVLCHVDTPGSIIPEYRRLPNKEESLLLSTEHMSVYVPLSVPSACISYSFAQFLLLHESFQCCRTFCISCYCSNITWCYVFVPQLHARLAVRGSCSFVVAKSESPPAHNTSLSWDAHTMVAMFWCTRYSLWEVRGGLRSLMWLRYASHRCSPVWHARYINLSNKHEFTVFLLLFSSGLLQLHVHIYVYL